jgi:hypothetical protein
MDAAGGAIHDKVVELEHTWMREFTSYVVAAQQRGEIRDDADAAQLTFELYACMELANYHFVLFRDSAVLERGRRAVSAILRRAQPTP